MEYWNAPTGGQRDTRTCTHTHAHMMGNGDAEVPCIPALWFVTAFTAMRSTVPRRLHPISATLQSGTLTEAHCLYCMSHVTKHTVQAMFICWVGPIRGCIMSIFRLYTLTADYQFDLLLVWFMLGTNLWLSKWINTVDACMLNMEYSSSKNKWFILL